MSQPVFYHSGMAGFPGPETRSAGGFLAVLDACLADGANVTGVTGLAQSGGVATATFASNHNFAVGDSVLVRGAAEAVYNGRKLVTAKSATALQFPIDSGAPASASGTMEVLHPGAGWAKAALATNAATYRSATSDGGMGHYLQVEDNNVYADANVGVRLRGCMGHTGALDSATLLGEQLRTNRLGATYGWWLAADDRSCYMGWERAQTLCFGEIKATAAGDTSAWMLTRGESGTGYNDGGWYQGRHFPAVPHAYFRDGNRTYWAANLLRDCTQTLGDALMAPLPLMGPAYRSVLGASQAGYRSTHPADGSMLLAPIFAVEYLGPSQTAANCTLRGRLRGVQAPLGGLDVGMYQTAGFQRLQGVLVDGVARTMVLVRLGPDSSAYMAIDLDGPW